MSIARAFTTRRVKQSLQTSDLNSSPQRSNTKGSISIRNKISSPVELIHTTNMLSYNAPDLYPKTASSAGYSHRSDDDMSDSAHTSGTTPPTSPDIESSPKRIASQKRVLSPEPNHLSAYFTAASNQTVEPARQTEKPVIPQRAPSHSKKSQSELARQRSMSGLSDHSQHTVSTKASYTFSRSSSSSTATTTTSQNSHPTQRGAKVSNAAANAAAIAAFVMSSPPRPQRAQRSQHRKDYSETQHPFGPELAQVSEIAEEYGIKEQLNVAVAEEKDMLSKGLVKFSASDYLCDVREIYDSFFSEAEPVPVAASSWI
ncbi:hypothetical protein QBC35DRAFT_198734 [Podospora australis]|uniref:Uncharacterized protein n=1 Tax=Podospora australis TaxID=1536484 RepID=A0AAN6X246_9PEZI|nr:hypothetical protein QBC35DRAFT_198734 [Podospora australis]